MRTNLKLFHKGLFLISVPLAFELFFVGILYFFYNQASEESLRQAKSKEFVAEINGLSILILQSSYALLSFKALRSSAFLSDYDRLAAEIPRAEVKLEALCKDDEHRQLRLKQLKETINRVLHLMQRFREPSDSVSFLLENPLAFRMEMERDYRLFLEQINRIDAEEGQLQNNNSELIFRERFRDLLWLGIAANFGITCWLVLLFSKNITGRLDILADNAHRIANRQKLNLPFTGNDEIAELDQTFHRVAEDLKLAEQRKQDFVSMISHDLRSPLTSVQTTLALIQQSGEKISDSNEKRIANASRNIGRVNRMLEQLLDMEKLEAGMLKIAPSLTDLDTIIKQSIDSMHDQAGEKSIAVNYQPHRLIVSADSERLRQVLINILANAVKFAPNGTAIDITVLDKSNTVTVSVSDHGPGISPAEQQKVFDRFHQAIENPSLRSAGSGLGLAIAKALIEAHNGNIGVSSTEGKGSTFWFSIPSA
jgi:signal transduction histidine kinase